MQQAAEHTDRITHFQEGASYFRHSSFGNLFLSWNSTRIGAEHLSTGRIPDQNRARTNAHTITPYPIIMNYAKVDKIASQRGLMRKEIADVMGVPPGRISDWESGRWKPTAYHFLVLARFLGVPMEYLVDDKMTELPQAPAPSEGLSDEEQCFLMVGRRIGFDEALRRIYAETTLRQFLKDLWKRSTVEIRDPVAVKINGNLAEPEPPEDEANRESPAPKPPTRPPAQPRVEPRSLGTSKDIPTGRDRLDREKAQPDARELPHR